MEGCLACEGVLAMRAKPAKPKPKPLVIEDGDGDEEKDAFGSPVSTRKATTVPTNVAAKPPVRTVEEVLVYARKQMERHGLDWTVKVSGSSKSQGGCADYAKKELRLAEGFAVRVKIEDLKDVLLHEIAHGLVGKEAGHGPLWQQKAIVLGGTGRVRHVITYTPYKWKGECGCTVHPRYKRPRKQYICSRCKKPIQWSAWEKQ